MKRKKKVIKKKRKIRVKKPKTIKSFLIPILRKYSRYWPPRNECLKNSRTRPGYHKCSSCELEVHYKEIKADHISPVVSPTDGFVDWNTYIERLLCPIENWNAICYNCHDSKSRIELEIRKIYKKK